MGSSPFMDINLASSAPSAQDEITLRVLIGKLADMRYEANTLGWRLDPGICIEDRSPKVRGYLSRIGEGLSVRARLAELRPL